MALYTQFTSNQNKGIIWNIMCENGIFNTIPENKSVAVKLDFDKKINMIGETITDDDQLIKLNKRAIIEMVKDIKKYSVIAANNAEVQPMSLNYNAGDISQQRQKIFENELKIKQTDFEKFNSKPVPEKIDFSDKLDEPMGSELDTILAEQIKIREKQLHIVLEKQDKTAANKWLQNGQPPATIERVTQSPLLDKNTPMAMPMPMPMPRQLTIGDTIELDVSELNNTIRKKVSFIEPINDDFMTLFKNKENTISDNSPLLQTSVDALKTMLAEVLSNQQKILELLMHNK